MSFDSLEVSQEAGRPVELFTFSMPLQTFRYTSAEDDIVVGGETFEAIAIKRARVVQGQEVRNTTLTLEMPSDLELPAQYVLAAPSKPARVLIQRFHRGDGQLSTIFDGRVKSVGFAEDGYVAKVAVDPAISAIARQIPLFTFGASCENVLGDGFGGGPGLCDVNLGSPSFHHTAVVTAQSGLTVTVPGAAAFGDGWFNGGTMETSSGQDARLILFQVGDVLTLHINFPFPVVGSTVTIKAGCDRSIETCSVKFNKVDRFQGFAFVPRLNPFTSGLGPAVC